jgi:hypothetical protein
MRKVILSDGREIKVQELKFKHFKKLLHIIEKILSDVSKNELNTELYLEHAVHIVSGMTELSEEEIENMNAADSIKVLRACIEQIISDTNFLQEVKALIAQISQTLTSTVSQKSSSQKDIK